MKHPRWPVLLVLLAACASAPSLPSLGEARPEVVALALYGSFVIVEEAAANIAEDSTTSATTRQALIAADEMAAPIVRELRPLAERVEALRASGELSELRAALLDLEAQIAQAAPLVQRLSGLVTGARR